MEIYNATQVQQVYRGYAGRCRCGCSGKYYYPKNEVNRGLQIRGYEIGSDEISDTKVAIAVGMINKAVRLGKKVETDPKWVSYDYRNKDGKAKTVTIYFK